jgi:hypothetical protein
MFFLVFKAGTLRTVAYEGMRQAIPESPYVDRH